MADELGRTPPLPEPTPVLGVIWAFADAELDGERFELRRGGAVVAVQPRVLELLCYLAENHARLVTKDELLERVWSNADVSEAALSQAIMEARKALGDGGAQAILTVRGRGYRFAARVERRAPAKTETPVASPRVAPALRGQAFVGRARELAELDAALGEALAGRGRVVLVTGEPGIGKTRLVTELGTRAALRGARVRWGRCWEGGGGPALWPWPALVSGVSSAAPAFGVPPPSESAQARFQMFHAVTASLKAAAEASPLVLLLDDLHEAEEPALLLLRFFAREVGSESILVVGTYREEALAEAPSKRDLVASLARDSHPIRLAGLAPAEVAELLETAAGRPVSGDLARLVHTRTGGNPLFVDEILRALIAEQRLDATAAMAVRVPSGIREAIRSRLRPLGGAAELLSHAAVVGRDFDVTLVASVAALTVEKAYAALAPAVAMDVVEVTSEPSVYRFSHALLRQVLYEELSSDARARLHRRVGEALESTPLSDPSRLAALAHHFFSAVPEEGTAAKAVDYAERAALAARALTAYEEARAHYERALGLLELSPELEPRRFALLISLGHAERLAGDRTRAVATFERAVRLARSRGHARGVVDAALGYAEARREFIGVDPNLVALVEEALRVVGDKDSPERVELSSGLAVALTFLPALERRVALTVDAVAMARRLGQPRPLLRALEAHRWAIWGAATPAERLAITIEARALAEQTQDTEFVFETLVWEIGDRLELGEVYAVYGAMDAYARLAQSIGHPLARWRSAVWASMRAILEGRGDAEQRIDDAFAIGQQAQHDNVDFFFLGQRYTLLHQRGRLQEIRPQLAAIVAQMPTLIPFRAMLALADAAIGDVSSAGAEFERLAAADFAAIPHDLNRLITLVYLTEVCVLLGDRGRAAVLYEMLLPWSAFNAVGGAAGAVTGLTPLSLGLLAALLDRPADAALHLEAALARSLAMGARPFTARSQLAYARLLLEGDNASRAVEANDLLSAAVASSRALGLAGVLHDALALPRSAPAVEPPT